MELDAISVELSDLQIRNLRDEEEAPMQLLLLADPSQKVIQGYLKRGFCRIAEVNNHVIGTYVLLPTRPETIELVNVAVLEAAQGQGVGQALVRDALDVAREMGFSVIEVGTGNSSIGQLYLYQKCGFRIVGVDLDYFVHHYPDPIYENGLHCRDMIRLRQRL